MKNYVLIKGKEKVSKKYGGADVTYKLYQVVKNELVFIDNTTICNRTWGGEKWTATIILKRNFPKNKAIQKMNDYGKHYFTMNYDTNEPAKANLQVISY